MNELLEMLIVASPLLLGGFLLAYFARRSYYKQAFKRAAMHGTCFNRVTFDPSIYNGKACIKNSQVPISTIVRKLASGSSAEQLLAENPYLEDKDILQALEYAAACVTEIDRRQGTDMT